MRMHGEAIRNISVAMKATGDDQVLGKLKQEMAELKRLATGEEMHQVRAR